MYQPTTLLITLLAGLRVLAQTETTIGYDTIYDNAKLSLDDVACSTGTYGLKTKGYTTVGGLPNFPNVGAVPAVTGSDSPACGTCYEVTYNNKDGSSNTINILAVDVSKDGFTVSETAMKDLTGERELPVGDRVPASFVATSASNCHMSSS